MKKIALSLYLLIAFMLLVGCADDTDTDSTADVSESSSKEESVEEDTTEVDESATTNITEETNDDEVTVTNDSQTTINEKNEDEEMLSQYTSEQIEYARVWAQLGPNQEIDGLYIQHIPAGALINPNDEASAAYPEDVIQLAGGRIVDGSITYSGNGDGTINLYNVPYRWEKNIPEDLDENYMRELTEQIINETESIYIEPENGEDIINLIELQQVKN